MKGMFKHTIFPNDVVVERVPYPTRTRRASESQESRVNITTLTGKRT